MSDGDELDGPDKQDAALDRLRQFRTHQLLRIGRATQLSLRECQKDCIKFRRKALLVLEILQERMVTQCAVPRCERQPYRRGVCRQCYQVWKGKQRRARWIARFILPNPHNARQ